jgi:hypothetical protein
MRSGWSIKALHKLITLSSTYQQSSIENPDYLKSDPENELLWRFNRQRLDAEAIRDTMLLLAGQLDLTPGGAHPFPSEYEWDYTQHYQFTAIYETSRRSVYLMQQRIKKHPFLATFDGPDPNSSTAERTATTTPLQALFMMNDTFAHEQADHLAARLKGCSEPGRIDAAYRLVFGRRARVQEVSEGSRYLEQFRQKLRARAVASEEQDRLAWASFARALLTSNEFLYVD